MLYVAKTFTLLNVLFRDYLFFKVFEGRNYSSYNKLLRLVTSQPGGAVLVAHPYHEQKVTGSNPEERHQSVLYWFVPTLA